MSQIVDNYFLYVEIFKSIRIINKLWLVIYSVLIRFKLLCSSSIASWRNIVNSFRCDTTSDKPINECNCMRSSSINCNVLRFLLSFEKSNIFWIFSKTLVKIRIIDRINSLNKVFVFVIWRIIQTAWNKSFVLEQSINKSYW